MISMKNDLNRVSFRNHYNRYRCISNPGCRFHTLYSGHYDENGTVVLDEKGREDIYEYIQSFKDSCDINVLLKRYQNGEIDVLARVQGTYGDFTDMPKTYAELLNKLSDGKTLFDSLPLETRAKFGHNFSEFMASIGSAEWFDKLGFEGSTGESGSSVEDSLDDKGVVGNE